jgi:drug/metabolite transporter (DMT)-like permease
MLKKITLFILFPVILTTLGEFCLKHAINQLSLDAADSVSLIQHAFTILGNPGVLAGLFCILCGGFLWVLAMSKFELSFLYPFLSINYIIIILGSHFFLKEEVSLYRYVSIVLITIGLIFISRSPYSENHHT